MELDKDYQAKQTGDMKQSPLVRILCIDGGGTRGIVAAEFLLEIEKRTKKKVDSCFLLLACFIPAKIAVQEIATAYGCMLYFLIKR